MRRSPIRFMFIWILMHIAIMSLLVGCSKLDPANLGLGSSGSKGADGTPAANGSDGAKGADGTNASDGFYLPDDLTFSITSATIGASTATVKFTAVDSFGRPYNRIIQSDVTNKYLVFFLAQLTPPANSGDTAQWKNYKSDVVAAPGVASPTFDTTGTLLLTNGTTAEYTYTFSFDPHAVTTPVAVTYNADYTHRVAIQTAYPGREIATSVANSIVKSVTFDFVPSGHAVDGITTVTKNIAKATSCNQCHAEIKGHDKYNDLNVCVMCHNSSANIGDGVNYDMNYMVHAIHSYNTKRTNPWRDPVHNTAYTGTATEENGLPQSSGNCRKCHHTETLSNGETATGSDGDIWKNTPNMKACTSCHNQVDFTSASTHKNWAVPGVVNGGVQTSNRNCSVCHYPEMIEAYHSSASAGSPHKPNAAVGTWEKGTITYPRLSYELTSATIDGGGNLLIDFAIKADGVVIDLLDATGSGNNKRFATSYSMVASSTANVKKSAATADLPYVKYTVPTVPSFYLAFAADQGSVLAADAVDWNNIGNGSAGAGQPLTVSLIRLGMKYWAQAYDGVGTLPVGLTAMTTGAVPCVGDPRQIVAGCDAVGASGAPTVVTGENINLGTLTPRYSGGGALIGFTATITAQTVPALNAAYKASGAYGTTLPHTLSYIYPYPAGAKLRAVGLGGYLKWDNQAIPYVAASPSGTAYTTNLISTYAQSKVIAVTGDTDRRTVVDPDKCASCHEVLSLHGGNRVYQPKICSMCHNAGLSTPGKTLDPDNPVASIHLKNFIHGIHGAEKRTTPLYFVAGTTLYSWTSNTWITSQLTTFDNFLNASNGVSWSKDSTVAAVALTKSTTLMSFPGKPQNCLSCHIDSTSTADATYGIEAIPANALESTKDITEDTADMGGGTGTLTGTRDSNYKGRMSYPHNSDITTKPISASCRGCHDGAVAKAHMELNGGKVETARNATQVGGTEICILCHGYGRLVDADVKHGVKSAQHP